MFNCTIKLNSIKLLNGIKKMKETKEKKNSTYSFDTHLIFHACFVHLFCCLSHNLRNCGWLCVTLHRRILDNLSQLTVDQDFFLLCFYFSIFFFSTEHVHKLFDSVLFLPVLTCLDHSGIMPPMWHKSRYIVTNFANW